MPAATTRHRAPGRLFSSTAGRREAARAWGLRVAICAAVIVFLVFGMAQTVRGGGPGEYVEVTVAPGDTVWSIAAAHYPGDDTRQRVDEVLAANQLRTPVIQPGQHLRIPAGG